MKVHRTYQSNPCVRKSAKSVIPSYLLGDNARLQFNKLEIAVASPQPFLPVTKIFKGVLSR